MVQLASVLFTGTPVNQVVCLSPQVNLVEGKKSKILLNLRSNLNGCIKKQNIREVCFRVMCEARGKNNGYASNTLNSERLASPQALEEVRLEVHGHSCHLLLDSMWFFVSHQRKWYFLRWQKRQAIKKKKLDLSDSSHPHIWAPAVTKKSPSQKSNIHKGLERWTGSRSLSCCWFHCPLRMDKEEDTTVILWWEIIAQ